MKMLKAKTMMAPMAASIALAVLMTSNVSAQAQQTESNNGTFQSGTSRHYKRMPSRPLTVRRRMAPAPVAAAAAAPAAAGAIIAAPIGAASTLVGLPFQVVGGAFGTGGGPRKGGVTAVRYAGTGKEQAKIDEGWAADVPVDRSGPIFVVENGDPTVSPLTFIGAPIAAAGNVAQLPFRILQAPLTGTF